MTVHGLTLAEMRNEVKLLLGNRSTSEIPNSRYDLWINLAEIEIVSAFQFFQTEKSYSFNLVTGVREYPLPSDCLAVYDLRDNTLKRKIYRSHYRRFDRTDVEASGDPTHYIRFGNSIFFNFKPSSTNEIELRYCRIIDKMVNDTDVPTIPAPWHECLILGAEFRGWRALGEYDRMVVVKNEYLALVRSRQAEYEIEDSDEEFAIELLR